MKYRLYIDEVGNSDLDPSHVLNHRYLSLTGVILEFDYASTIVFPAIEGLKRDFFGSHPDEPLILHRKELVNKNYPFDSLRDPATEEAFNQSFLTLLQNLEYRVITVVMDKLELNQRHQVWRFDPYYDCMAVLVDRYVLWLKSKSARGDVMAESRGGKQDRGLKESFEDVYTNGSDFLDSDMFMAHLTSRQIKIKPKSANIAGLQLADIIAHPSFRASLARKNHQPLPDSFGGKIGAILEASKYVKGPDEQIDKWGREWLP